MGGKRNSTNNRKKQSGTSRGSSTGARSSSKKGASKKGSEARKESSGKQPVRTKSRGLLKSWMSRRNGIRLGLLAVVLAFGAGVTVGVVLGVQAVGPGPKPSEAAALAPDSPESSDPPEVPDSPGAPGVKGTDASETASEASRGSASENSDIPETGLGRAGEQPKASEPSPEKPAIPLYVVIDDVGNSLAQLEPFLEVDYPITFAVLPQRRYSREAAARIASVGQETILHLPMEALNGNDPGAGAITTSLNSDEISARLTANLTSVPGVIGVNNHMGSKATADEKTMEAVFRYLQEKDLFFLDSRTTAETLGKKTADKFQLSFAERHVFLDNEPNRDYVRQAVEQGMDIARNRGHAVLIGHVMVTEVAEVLEEMYPFIRDEGFDLHHLSDLVLGPKDDDTWD